MRGDGGEAVAVGFDQDVAADALAGEPGQVGEPATGHGGARGHGRPARSSRTRASACTPASQSACSACSAGECETPVGLRTNSMAVGIRAARIPASCPAPVGSTGAVIPAEPSTPVIRSRRFSSKRTSGVYDSRAAPNLTPCSAAAAAAAARDRVGGLRQGLLVRSPGVQPGPDGRIHPVGAARLGDDLPERGHGAVLGGQPAGGQHGARVRQHRVVPVGEPGRARVVGAAGEVETPPPVRPDPLGHADRRAQRRQGPALLHVQFDERAHPREQVLVGSEQAGVAARGRHRRGQRDAVVVAQRAGGGRVDDPGDEAAAQAGDPEAGAFFLGEDRDSHGPFGIKVPDLQLVHGGQRGHDPERSVVTPAVRDRIQVAAGDDGAGPFAGPHQAQMLPLLSGSTARPNRSAWRVNQARHSASAGVQE